MTEDDLILNKDGVPEELAAEDVVWDETMPVSYVDTAMNVLTGLEEMDTGMMSKEDFKRVKQMRRWSIRIAHHYLREIFLDLVAESEPDEED